MNPLRQLLYVMNDSHFMTTVRLHDFYFKNIYLCSTPLCQLNSLYWCFNCLIIIMIYFSFWGRCDKEAQWSCCLHSREVLGLDLCSDPPVGGVAYSSLCGFSSQIPHGSLKIRNSPQVWVFSGTSTVITVVFWKLTSTASGDLCVRCI